MQFQNVCAAFELLSDHVRRHQLDMELEAERLTSKFIINDTLLLSEMSWSESEGQWWSECRCGGVYSIRDQQVKLGSIVVGCDTCSLAIKVIKPS